jgi:hypothetical protein
MDLKTKKFLTPTVLLLSLVATNSTMGQTLVAIFPKGDKPNALVFLALTLLALFLALAIHELGHLVAGLLQGFRFELFVVGLLGVKRAGTSIEVYLNKNLGYMGGVAATIPIHPDVSNRKKFAIIVAAGPVASFLFSIVSFGLMVSATSGAARGFWFIAGAVSVGVFLATTIPTKTGVFFTDRARFLRLISRGKAGEIEEALLTILAIQAKEDSCRNIPLSMIKLLQTDTDKAMKFWGYYYEYSYFKDHSMTEETEEALKKLLSAKSTIPDSLWKALEIENNPHK